MSGNIYRGEADSSRRDVLKGIGALGATAVGASYASGDAQAVGERAVYQYYHTDWNTVRGNLSAVANAGYDAIQVPPAQYSKLSKSDRRYDAEKYQTPLGYQPIDHKNFTSAFGTESEYQAMVEEAHRNGLDVIADAVMNHMAFGVPFEDFPWFSYSDFHHEGEIDYSDPWSVENGDLSGLPDLKQESSYVRGQLEDYVDKYANLGVDGIRFDAAKHMPEWFFRDFATNWADEYGLYKVGEVLNGDLNVCDGYAQTGMSVTDYPLYYTMKEDAFHQDGDLRALDNGGYVDQNPFGSMTFVSNHDSRPPQYERMAYAYILTYEGYPRVYNHRIGPNDGDINNLLWIRNNLAGGPAVTRHSGRDLYVFEREGNLLVGLNRTDSWKSKWVPTSWYNQTLNDYSGNAGDVTTNGDAWVELWIPPTGWVCYAP
jgi:alpha-amylase